MSFQACSGVKIVKTSFSKEDFGQLHNVLTEKDNIGYHLKFSDKDWTRGTFSWMKNFKNRFNVQLREEIVDFVLIDNYFVFLVSTSSWIKYFKNMIQEVFEEEKTMEMMKLPFNPDNEFFKKLLKEEVTSLFELEKDNFIEVSLTGVRFYFTREDANFLVSYDVLGLVQFGLGKTEKQVLYIAEKIIILSEKMNHFSNLIAK